MMQQYRFRPLQRDEIPFMLDLIHLRIAWMDQVGIRQWNVTDYDGVYPPAYYQACYDLGELFALEELSTGRIVCVGALKAKDPRWPDAAPDAFYLHHLAADPAHKGAGRAFLRGAEAQAQAAGKTYLRLDSAIDNPVLTAYYEQQGYLPVGTCVDGLYEGILRQKSVVSAKRDCAVNAH